MDTSICQIVGESLSLVKAIELFEGMPLTSNFYVEAATFVAPALTVKSASSSGSAAILIMLHCVLLPRNQRGLTVSIVF
jgi:hypothetical protein